MFILINKSIMPSYLSERHFQDWHKKINSAVSSIGFTALVTDNLSIEFSNDRKIKRYGSKPIDEIIDKIRKRWKTDRRIDEVLQQAASSNDASANGLASILAELLLAVNKGESYDSIRSELDDMLGDLAFERLVLGEYIHSLKKIVLYAQNIECSLCGKSKEEAFEVVFAHEMLHAYHYQNDDDEIVLRRDYTSKVVKEALASAFEWYYLTKNKIDGADDLQHSWYEYSVFSYPYSGAQNLIAWENYTGEYCLDKTYFCEIFDRSLFDMDGALRSLIELDDFYKIKNAITVSTKHIVKKAMLTRAEFDASFVGKSVPQIAREEIPPIIKSQPYLINDLLDLNYCKAVFKYGSYTVLSPTRIYKSNQYRSYKNGIITSIGTYYLCNNWYERHRKSLLDWLWINKI